MKWIVCIIALLSLTTSCKLSNTNPNGADNKELSSLFDSYYQERLQLYPVEATMAGDNRYNDRLSIDFTDGYRKQLKDFYNKHLTYLTKFDRANLNAADQLSYDIFQHEMRTNIEALGFHDNYTPMNHFQSFHLIFGQLGSGTVIQPFQTVADYENWLKRAAVFPAYADSAIVYFKKGMAANYVLPEKLVLKMIPQMQAMVTANASENLFYGPVNVMPVSFAAEDKKRLATAYVTMINEQLIPAFSKLAKFLKDEYLPKTRTSTGIAGVPGGADYYQFLIRQQTTTKKTADEIYATGLTEVARIRAEMERTKESLGFKDSLAAFFQYMKIDPKFTPYRTPKEVLDAYRAIQQVMEPQLKNMFGTTPKTPFEIRQTEAFRAASASAEYFQGSVDGTRPGIFYVPILDATQFNTTSGMQSLFLHEAIPGHHYQISLQQENQQLPRFRRFLGTNAYAEGWALYCESLGKELGLYTDPYQYMGALGDEMHRAIRLVVDVGMHAKGMTREEAIAYMMANEPISEEGAVAEIERYMVIPAQALGYKIGALKIRELRTRYEKQLGAKFKLSAFHDAVLKEGNMPLLILESYLDQWAAKQNK